MHGRWGHSPAGRLVSLGTLHIKWSGPQQSDFTTRGERCLPEDIVPDLAVLLDGEVLHRDTHCAEPGAMRGLSHGIVSEIQAPNILANLV
jgi:hypothetical protein